MSLANQIKQLLIQFSEQKPVFSSELSPAQQSLLELESRATFSFFTRLAEHPHIENPAMKIDPFAGGSVRGPYIEHPAMKAKMRRYLRARWEALRNCSAGYTDHPFLPANRLCLGIAELIAAADEPVIAIVMPRGSVEYPSPPSIYGELSFLDSLADLKKLSESNGHFSPEEYVLNEEQTLLLPVETLFSLSYYAPALLFESYSDEAGVRHPALSQADIELLARAGGEDSRRYLDALRQKHVSGQHDDDKVDLKALCDRAVQSCRSRGQTIRPMRNAPLFLASIRELLEGFWSAEQCADFMSPHVHTYMDLWQLTSDSSTCVSLVLDQVASRLDGFNDLQVFPAMYRNLSAGQQSVILSSCIDALVQQVRPQRLNDHISHLKPGPRQYFLQRYFDNLAEQINTAADCVDMVAALHNPALTLALLTSLQPKLDTLFPDAQSMPSIITLLNSANSENHRWISEYFSSLMLKFADPDTFKDIVWYLLDKEQFAEAYIQYHKRDRCTFEEILCWLEDWKGNDNTRRMNPLMQAAILKQFSRQLNEWVSDQGKLYQLLLKLTDSREIPPDLFMQFFSLIDNRLMLVSCLNLVKAHPDAIISCLCVTPVESFILSLDELGSVFRCVDLRVKERVALITRFEGEQFNCPERFDIFRLQACDTPYAINKIRDYLEANANLSRDVLTPSKSDHLRIACALMDYLECRPPATRNALKKWIETDIKTIYNASLSRPGHSLLAHLLCDVLNVLSGSDSKSAPTQERHSARAVSVDKQFCTGFFAEHRRGAQRVNSTQEPCPFVPEGP